MLEMRGLEFDFIAPGKIITLAVKVGHCDRSNIDYSYSTLFYDLNL